VTQVRGAFSPGGADWRTGQLNVQLSPLAGMNRGAMSMGAAANRDAGTFEFRQVFPGSYMLVVVSPGSEENRFGAWQRVDVSDRPVELAVELKRAIELTGKVEIEAGGNPNIKVTPAQINIQLISQFQFSMPGSGTQASDDGTFTMKGVLPAPWRLQVNAPFGFLKAAWLGSTEVTNAPLDLSGGAVGPLKILVSTNTATIRGSAPAGQNVMAQLVDETLPFQGSRGTQADQNGQYKFEGLAPGKYRLAIGGQADESGQEVTVREGETVTADMKTPQFL
jgi:hypothetical protein